MSGDEERMISPQNHHRNSRPCERVLRVDILPQVHDGPQHDVLKLREHVQTANGSLGGCGRIKEEWCLRRSQYAMAPLLATCHQALDQPSGIYLSLIHI